MKTRNRFETLKLLKILCEVNFRKFPGPNIFTIGNPIEIPDVFLEFRNILEIVMFFMKITSKIGHKIFFQTDFRQLQIFKSISGLHCDFKCKKVSLESPARGSRT